MGRFTSGFTHARAGRVADCQGESSFEGRRTVDLGIDIRSTSFGGIMVPSVEEDYILPLGMAVHKKSSILLGPIFQENTTQMKLSCDVWGSVWEWSGVAEQPKPYTLTPKP